MRNALAISKDRKTIFFFPRKNTTCTVVCETESETTLDQTEISSFHSF